MAQSSKKEIKPCKYCRKNAVSLTDGEDDDAPEGSGRVHRRCKNDVARADALFKLSLRYSRLDLANRRLAFAELKRQEAFDLCRRRELDSRCSYMGSRITSDDEPNRPEEFVLLVMKLLPGAAWSEKEEMESYLTLLKEMASYIKSLEKKEKKYKAVAYKVVERYEECPEDDRDDN